MAFGDTAKAALGKAVEALESVAAMGAIIGQVQTSQAQFEARLERRMEALESRIRELERENARLNGLVASSYGEAVKVLMEHQRPVRGSSPVPSHGVDGEPTDGQRTLIGPNSGT